MIRNTPSFLARSPWPLLFVGATGVMLAMRIAHAGTDPVAWVRVGIGAVCFGVLLFLKHGGFARAAAYAFAIECGGALGLFAFVDAPAVQSHAPAIARAVAAIAPHGLR